MSNSPCTAPSPWFRPSRASAATPPSVHYATYAARFTGWTATRSCPAPSTPMAEADLRQVLAEQLGSADVPGAIHLPA